MAQPTHLNAKPPEEQLEIEAMTRVEESAEAKVRRTNTEVLRTDIMYEKIRDWIRYPEVVTPFPWADAAEWVTPCNWDDLDYYESCPRGFPAGVREWRERLYAHHRSIGLPLE